MRFYFIHKYIHEENILIGYKYKTSIIHIGHRSLYIIGNLIFFLN